MTLENFLTFNGHKACIGPKNPLQSFCEFTNTTGAGHKSEPNIHTLVHPKKKCVQTRVIECDSNKTAIPTFVSLKLTNLLVVAHW